MLKLTLTLSPVPRKLFCVTAAFSSRPLPWPKPTPAEMLPDARSLTVKLTSTWSGLPGTAGVSTVTSSKKPSRSRRTRERSTAAEEKVVASSWRISRRITSSAVFSLPAKLMRRT